MKIWKISRLDFTLTKKLFLRLNKEQHLLGIVHFNNIRIILILTELNTIVKDIMAPAEVIYLLILWKRLWTNLNAQNGFYRLLKMKYFGFISKSIALEAYHQKLKAMTIE
jgi:CIC family chloride channel protein